MRTLILCTVLTGMRRGALLGLRWEDVDLESHRIFVRRALWRGKLVTPKWWRSRRTIDRAPTLRAALARLPSRFQGGLVFFNPDGTPLDPDNFAHRECARGLRRAELRRVRFHDLRHTYASLLIAQGAHPKYIQAARPCLDPDDARPLRASHRMPTPRRRGSWTGWCWARTATPAEVARRLTQCSD